MELLNFSHKTFWVVSFLGFIQKEKELNLTNLILKLDSLYVSLLPSSALPPSLGYLNLHVLISLSVKKGE